MSGREIHPRAAMAPILRAQTFNRLLRPGLRCAANWAAQLRNATSAYRVSRCWRSPSPLSFHSDFCSRNLSSSHGGACGIAPAMYDLMTEMVPDLRHCLPSGSLDPLAMTYPPSLSGPKTASFQSVSEFLVTYFPIGRLL